MSRSVFIVFLCLTGFCMGRRGGGNNDAAYKCYKQNNCECEDSSRQYFENCYKNLPSQSQQWFFDQLNQCEGLTEQFEKQSILDLAPKLCKQEESVLRPCFDAVMKKIREASQSALNGDYGEDLQTAVAEYQECMNGVGVQCNQNSRGCI